MSTVLLCATDAGGASNLASLSEALDRHRVSAVLVTSSRCLHFFEPVGRYVRVVLDPQEDVLAALIEETRPTAVVCGTTRDESPDRQAVRLARARGIPSLAVVDERYLYRSRFAGPGGELVDLPDAIALVDEDAVREATAEGLPKRRCHATGSPALSRLVTLVERFGETPPGRPHYLRTVPAWPVVTFLSETFASDYGVGVDQPGSLGPFVGYTETSVYRSVLEVLGTQQAAPVVSVEKLHPASAEDPDVTPVLASNHHYHVRVKQVDLWALLWHSSLVIGMRSMALLEAHLFGVPTVSYQPGLIGAERCTAVRLGLIPRLSTPAQLASWCQLQLSQPGLDRRIPAVRSPFAAVDAADRLLAIALTSAVVERA